MTEHLQAKNIDAAFSSVLAQTFGSSDNAPGSVYSPQRTDMMALQRRFPNTTPQQLKSVYEMTRGDVAHAVRILVSLGQQDTASITRTTNVFL
jgi:hypothetical protein